MRRKKISGLARVYDLRSYKVVSSSDKDIVEVFEPDCKFWSLKKCKKEVGDPRVTKAKVQTTKRKTKT